MDRSTILRNHFIHGASASTRGGGEDWSGMQHGFILVAIEQMVLRP